MESVSITELNQQTRAVLDRVRAGERLVITDRGRPIAQLGPAPVSRWERLVAAGVVTPASRPEGVRIEPTRIAASVQEIMDELREERS